MTLICNEFQRPPRYDMRTDWSFITSTKETRGISPSSSDYVFNVLKTLPVYMLVHRTLSAMYHATAMAFLTMDDNKPTVIQHFVLRCMRSSTVTDQDTQA